MKIDQEVIDEMKELAKKEVRAINPVVFQKEEKALYRKVEQKYGSGIAIQVLQKLWKIVNNERSARGQSVVGM